jgi:hypothetical protein
MEQSRPVKREEHTHTPVVTQTPAAPLHCPGHSSGALTSTVGDHGEGSGAAVRVLPRSATLALDGNRGSTIGEVVLGPVYSDNHIASATT